MTIQPIRRNANDRDALRGRGASSARLAFDAAGMRAMLR